MVKCELASYGRKSVVSFLCFSHEISVLLMPLLNDSFMDLFNILVLGASKVSRLEKNYAGSCLECVHLRMSYTSPFRKI